MWAVIVLIPDYCLSIYFTFKNTCVINSKKKSGCYKNLSYSY